VIAFRLLLWILFRKGWIGHGNCARSRPTGIPAGTQPLPEHSLFPSQPQLLKAERQPAAVSFYAAVIQAPCRRSTKPWKQHLKTILLFAESAQAMRQRLETEGRIGPRCFTLQIFKVKGGPGNAPHFYSRSFLRTSVPGQVRKMRKDSHRGPGVDHLLGFCHSWITRAPVGIRILNARVRSGLRSLRSMPCANAVILADFMPSVAMGPRRTALAICVELKLRPAPVSISRAPRVPRQ
jgi:hypothetical protein